MKSKQIIANLSRLFLYFFTAAYIIGGMLLHVEVSYLVVGKYPEVTGEFVPREYSVEFSIFVLMLIAVYFFAAVRKGRRLKATLIYWTIYAVVLVIFYLYISLHQVEIIHLIQYSGAAILLGYSLDPGRKKFLFGKILFLGTILGIIDELLQYYAVSPGHIYLDFNDFFVNSLGVIGGLLFYYGFKELPEAASSRLKPFYQTKRFSFCVVFFTLITVFMLQGYLQISPPYKIKPGSVEAVDGQLVVFMERVPGLLGSWQKHFVEGLYYALTPLEGMLLIFITVFIFSTFDPRVSNKLCQKIISLKKIDEK